VNFGCDEDLFAWDARSADSIGARLLIAVRPGRVDVAVSGAEGVEGDRFGDICGPIEIDSGTHVQNLTQIYHGPLDMKGEIGCLTV
jgi:hypothetical protein